MAELLEFSSASTRKVKRSLEESGKPAPSQDVHSDDAAARELALDPSRSFIVDAPAGSGKTGLLVQRFLNLLGSPSTTLPEEILAITFTRKATAELRERISLQLEAADLDSPLGDPASAFERKTRDLARAALHRDRQLGWDLLSNPRRLRIQTIDSLCMEIAGTLPLLSGSAARTPVDDASELYREAARRTLRQLGGPDRTLDDALNSVLLHRDANLADVETLLAEMLATREQWAELVPLDRASLTDAALDQEVRPRLERTLEQIVCSGLARAAKVLPSHALATLAELAHSYADEAGYASNPNPFALCREHPGPPAAEAAHLDHWRALIDLLFTGSKCDWRKGFNHNHIGIKLSKFDKEKLQQLIAEIQCEPLREALEAVRDLPPSRYPDDQWLQAKALFRLLLHALAELRLLFAETGQCDFTEFSLAARQALAQRPEDFATGSGASLRHLLVDEVQDTSSAQYGLLTDLTRTWDGSSQTLFLVGDPKQSIYLFRQARVERFLNTTRDARLGDIPLRPLQLTANFRSRPAVVEGVNRDFTPLFAAPGQPLSPEAADVPFVAAAATRPIEPASGVHWHTRILSTTPQGSEQTSHTRSLTDSSSRLSAAGIRAAVTAPENPAQQDAFAIRRIVERWQATPLPEDRRATVGRPAKPWRIAVLVYARRHLAPIVMEFRRPESPIPFRAIKVEPLGDRPEVLDAFALTRALHHPADRAAWFAVLRAPWCGLSAADLLTLVAEGDPAHAKSTVPELVKIRGMCLSEEGLERVQRIWPSLQDTFDIASRSNSNETVLRTWLSLGGDAPLTAEQRSNVDRYFRLLRDCENFGRLDIHRLKRRLKDLYAEPTPNPDAVELTTIHNAKGLEWDVVIVPELGRRGQPERARLLNWLELESASEPAVLLAPIHGKGDDPTSLYKWLSRIHSRRIQAERKRVFYVACTRAREELHLFATATHGKEKLVAASGSLLHACWPAAAPHFSGALEAIESSDSTTYSLRFAQPMTVLPSAQTVDDGNNFALAASAELSTSGPVPTFAQNQFLPRLTRLPLHFDPRARFHEAGVRRLPYTPASELAPRALLVRPEGSLAARALGNVVHRFLEHTANRLAAGTAVVTLQNELPSWLDRLAASLRGEGLAPTEAGREASRALTLLANTLADPIGLWLLSPHPEAASERPLATSAGLLRVDRTFCAGQTPSSAGESTPWVVDFKTTAPGGRSPEQFLAEQQAIYGPQLTRYAEALRAASPITPAGIQLGLYFPAIPRLVHWPAPDVERGT